VPDMYAAPMYRSSFLLTIVVSLDRSGMGNSSSSCQAGVSHTAATGNLIQKRFRGRRNARTAGNDVWAQIGGPGASGPL
jgi:hypothetical protein